MDGRFTQLFRLGLGSLLCTGLFVFLGAGPGSAWGQLVPGTGTLIPGGSDDFEDVEWEYRLNAPKSSYEQDHNVRLPGGISRNGVWAESAKRGQPDLIRRVATPEAGIPGSGGALLLATKASGVPGRPSGRNQQDDLLINASRTLGRAIPVSWSPNCVVRVYVPPFEAWEQRVGSSFGFRADVKGVKGGGQLDSYWPGMFLQLRRGNGTQADRTSGVIVVRAGNRGQDFQGPKIESPGWWTLGMSFTPDGRVHYYASEGVDDLTTADHVSSQYPYGFRCRTFHTYFFNVANRDDGRTWSTQWVIDDAQLFHRNGNDRTARPGR